MIWFLKIVDYVNYNIDYINVQIDNTQKTSFSLLPNWNEYDGSDNFRFDCEPDEIPFGT